MRFILAIFGTLLIVGAARAEAGNSDDVIIIDKTKYGYCMDSTNRIVSTARPPYYVALMCTDFHSTNPLLATRCNSYMPYSEPDSKDNYRASRLTAIWMQANVTKAARVPARFS